MTIRVLLADDHEIVREGLRAVIANESGLTVVAEAMNGRDAVARTGTELPDAVIMDIGMPGLSGIEATRQIRRKYPKVRIVAFSQYGERQVVASMLRAGAAGYVLKSDPFGEVVKALHHAMRGERYLSKALATEFDSNVLGPNVGENGKPVLTSRQLEVLQLLVEGRSTAEIAATLYVSPNTVGTHRYHIMNKLGARSLADLTRYALRESLIFSDAPPSELSDS